MFTMISKEEIQEVLKHKNSDKFLIGVDVKSETNEIKFLTGDNREVVVPFSLFKISGDGTKPDFSDVSIIDYGQTVKLGVYEASVEAVLSEVE